MSYRGDPASPQVQPGPAGEPTIESCDVDDTPVVAAIARETFLETYAEETSPDQLRKHVARAYGNDQVAEELSEPDSAFFIARLGDTVTGYLKVNRGPAQTELKDAGGLEIESLYVLRAFQGRRIGMRLLDRALEEARKGGAEYIWLGVWERNLAGRRFWQRMGFVEFGSHSFQFADEQHTDLMMRKDLRAPSI